MAVIFFKWPETLWFLKILLLYCLMVEFISCYKGIIKNKGALIFIDHGEIFWQEQHWQIESVFSGIGNYVSFLLKSSAQDQYQRLWLTVDNLSKKEWCSMNYILLNYEQSQIYKS